tara:strand:- start:674 stop:967 length:294 start_codon:yes stop_codon:yes gene_type:complete
MNEQEKLENFNISIEKIHGTVNETYKNNFPKIIKGFRENNDPNELSYDFEEVFEENQTIGDLQDFLVENEKCEIWDIPYITYLVLNHPEKVYIYFQF